MKVKKLKRLFDKFQQCSVPKNQLSKIKGGNGQNSTQPDTEEEAIGTEDIMDL